MARDIYMAIMIADAKGKGLHLSADEVSALSLDSAIEYAALNALDEVDWPEHIKFTSPDWVKIDPDRDRRPANLTIVAPEDTERDKRRAAVRPS